MEEDGCEGAGRSRAAVCTAVTTTKAVVYPTIAINRAKLLLFLSLWKGREYKTAVTQDGPKVSLKISGSVDTITFVIKTL